MKEVFRKTEIGIKYAFLFVFLGVGSMVSSIMMAVEPVWDDPVAGVMTAGALMLLFSLLFTWDLIANKKWSHKIFGILALIWTVLLLLDIFNTFRELFFI